MVWVRTPTHMRVDGLQERFPSYAALMHPRNQGNPFGPVIIPSGSSLSLRVYCLGVYRLHIGGYVARSHPAVLSIRNKTPGLETGRRALTRRNFTEVLRVYDVVALALKTSSTASEL